MSGATALRRWLCEACGLVYDEARGDPDSGIAPGTRFEDIPDDWRCPVCGVGKADFVLMQPQAARAPAAPREGANMATASASASASAPAARRGGVVIVGAGIAGWSMARALREAGYDRALKTVSACDARVYQKPLLSVALARGLDAARIGARSGESLAAELGVRLLPRTWAIDLDPSDRRLVTTRGTLRWDALVIATGSGARRPAIAGDGVERLLPLNDLAQYARMRAALDAARTRAAAADRPVRVAIVGAGLVGCELADDLAGAGVAVTLIESAELPLQARLGEARAVELAEALRGRGIRFFGASAITDARVPPAVSDAGDDVASVELAWSTSGGLAHRGLFDFAIAAVGTNAQTRLARVARLAVDRGIVVRPASLSTGADGVFALGDCAEVEGSLGGTIEPIHRQACAIAGAIVGRPAPYELRTPTWVVKMPSFPVVIRPQEGAVATDPGAVRR